jgi:hypothetical protein
MDTTNLRDFISFCWNFCHLGLALAKSPQIMQTGSQILTEVGRTTSIKKQPVKWMAHTNETATQNQQWYTYMSQLCQECIFWILVLLPPNYNMTAALQMQIPYHTIP